MGSVAKSKKPKLTVHIDPEDDALLKDVNGHFPGVAEAFLVRAALRVALPLIYKDRSLLKTPVITKPVASLNIRVLPQDPAPPPTAPAPKHHSPPAEASKITGQMEKDLEGDKGLSERRKKRGKQRAEEGSGS